MNWSGDPQPVDDGYEFQLHLVNARELKQVPGRKSDVRDCQWIAHLLACGLLRSSFVPERGQRQLRDLTRHRAQLHAEHTRCANRIRGKLRKKIPDLKQALRGHVMEHHRFMLGQLLDHLALLEDQLESFSRQPEVIRPVAARPTANQSFGQFDSFSESLSIAPSKRSKDTV